MDIRKLEEEEKKEAENLDAFAFQFEPTEEQSREFRERMIPDNIWVAVDDGQILSKVDILPTRMWVYGASMAAGGVSGVATWPEGRRGGNVRQLLKQSLRDMKSRGHVLSLLDPFAVSYYRKFGWELYCDQTTAVLKKEEFPVPSKGGTGRFRRVKDEDWGVFKEIYDQYAPRYSGMIDRDEWWWKNILLNARFKNKRRIVYQDDEGNDRGYVFYNVKNEVMKVSEFVAVDQEAESELWRLIANHDSMVKEMRITMPNDLHWRFFMQNPDALEERSIHFMARIVDMERFLAQFPFQLEEGEQLSLSVSDDFAEWNTGSYQVEKKNEQTVVHKNPATTGLVLETDIKGLIPFLFRYVDGETLHNSGIIKGSKAAITLWEKAIPEGKPFLYDAF
ncbi:GNAT family N-acetyltransferase [Natribacillus halophilus]|uniref:Predicted acetyltransferase n=1 Tax=Natribacillus halophilus TaxID=549003 RepID=A0A1G8MC60_9BACI|nr:GNAT family N-acetyltransferase [Natribacillus halophilus]SDI65519.1 Predicted acetyltransferase [Natribacillus halophilus]